MLKNVFNCQSCSQNICFANSCLEYHVALFQSKGYFAHFKHPKVQSVGPPLRWQLQLHFQAALFLLFFTAKIIRASSSAVKIGGHRCTVLFIMHSPRIFPLAAKLLLVGYEEFSHELLKISAGSKGMDTGVLFTKDPHFANFLNTFKEKHL